VAFLCVKLLNKFVFVVSNFRLVSKQTFRKPPVGLSKHFDFGTGPSF